MRSQFRYTGLRVQDLDAAVEFFTEVMGMRLEDRIKVESNKGEFANLKSGDGKHWLELNWYADDSPVAGPFREGEELDHLGFEVDDFDEALEKLKEAGYPPKLGPYHVQNWHISFVPTVDGIWLDVFHVDRRKPRKTKKRATPKRATRKRRG